MSDAQSRHTYFCVGGPLHGQRYHAPGISFTIQTLDGARVRYEIVTVIMRDGPVSFWALAKTPPEAVMGALLRGISSDALADLVTGQ